jgi:carbon starvation protein
MRPSKTGDEGVSHVWSDALDRHLDFFAQRDKFRDAIDQGQVLAPAKSMDDMHSVVTNSTVDGVLAALFAVLIVTVVLDAARVWVNAIRAREPLETTETPFVESELHAPAGLWETREERDRELVGAGSR